jgi:hypothetical protein
MKLDGVQLRKNVRSIPGAMGLAGNELEDGQRLEVYLEQTRIHRDAMYLPGNMKKNVLLVVEEVERLRPALAEEQERNALLLAAEPMVEVRMMQQVE